MRFWFGMVMVLLLGLSGPMSLHANDHPETDEHATHGLILAFAEDGSAHIESDFATHDAHGEDESHHTGHIHIGHDHSSLLPNIGQQLFGLATSIRYGVANEQIPVGQPTSLLRPPNSFL